MKPHAVLAAAVLFPDLFAMKDGSKVDAVVTWTLTPGRGQ